MSWMGFRTAVLLIGAAVVIGAIVGVVWLAWH